MRLDTDLERARNDLGAMSIKLRRTRTRGVYQLGFRYVVPYFDTVGVEHRKEFETIDDARAFRHALAAERRPPDEYAGGSYRGADSAGTGGHGGL